MDLFELWFLSYIYMELKKGVIRASASPSCTGTIHAFFGWLVGWLNWLLNVTINDKNDFVKNYDDACYKYLP